MSTQNQRKAKETTGLTVGQPAPLFSATDQYDEPFELAEALSQGPVVLIFYRGQWCPFCNQHLKLLQSNLDRIYATGAQVIAVSPETSPYLRKMMQKANIAFKLLYDQDYQIAQAYQVSFRPGTAHRFMYDKVLGANMARAHEQETILLPVPATYIINQAGQIAWRHFDPDYKQRSEIEDILNGIHHASI